MPLYDYLCRECGFIHVDLEMTVAEGGTEKIMQCPRCQKQTNHSKQLGSTLNKFKGDGWTTPNHGIKR